VTGMDDTWGLLYARAGRSRFRLARRDPAPELHPFVEHYWTLEWDLRGQEPIEQQVLPEPAVNLMFGPGWARVTGVSGGRFCSVPDDAGLVLGVRFRPGGFHPFLGSPMTALTGRSVAVGEVLGRDGTVLADAVRAAPDEDGKADAADEFLTRVAPDRDPAAEAAARIVDRVAADPGITQVDDLTRDVGVEAPDLQRLLSEYVGVGPRWVIQRYRMHDAAQRAAAGAPVDWRAVAARLGYRDQDEFDREFTTMVGTTPGACGEACAAAAPVPGPLDHVG
jgi:AraC-like DNA-binding protein